MSQAYPSSSSLDVVSEVGGSCTPHIATHEGIATITVATVATRSALEYVATVAVVSEQLVSPRTTLQHVPIVEVVVGIEKVVIIIGQYAVVASLPV
jgi:hypothetical protein